MYPMATLSILVKVEARNWKYYSEAIIVQQNDNYTNLVGMAECVGVKVKEACKKVV